MLLRRSWFICRHGVQCISEASRSCALDAMSFQSLDCYRIMCTGSSNGRYRGQMTFSLLIKNICSCIPCYFLDSLDAPQAYLYVYATEIFLKNTWSSPDRHAGIATIERLCVQSALTFGLRLV